MQIQSGIYQFSFMPKECFEAFRDRRLKDLPEGGMGEWKQVSSEAKDAWLAVSELFNERSKRVQDKCSQDIDEVIRTTSAQVTEMKRIVDEYAIMGTKQS